MIPAFLIHISASALVAMLLSLLFGKLTPAIAVFSLAVGLASAWVAGRRFPEFGRFFESIETWWQKGICLFIAFVAFRHFSHLFFYARDGWRTLNPNNYGDLPLHLTYIRYFSAGNPFWPDNPIFPAEGLRYPLGIDLYSALWESLGVSTQGHLFFLGIIAFAVTLVLLHKWLGWWGVGAFFLNGSFAALAIFQTGKVADYQNQLAWKNFFLSLFVPQRGFLWALPAGVWLLKTAFDLFYEKRDPARHQFIPAGFVWGAMPFFHLHTFVAVSVLMGSWGLATRRWKQMLPALAIAVPLATAFILYSTDFFSKAGVAHIKWGWMSGEGYLSVFWWQNLGPWLFVPVWMAWEVWKGKLQEYRLYFAICVFWFFIFSFVMLAPWEWDNLKVMIWPYLCLVFLIKKGAPLRVSKKWEFAAGAVLFFSGIVSLAHSVAPMTGHEIFNAKEINNAKHVVESTPPGSVFATAPGFNHPVSFWGRAVVHGYKGHLWSHGINSDGVEKDLERLMKGGQDWKRIADKLGVTHIYWGEREIKQYGNRVQPWKWVLKDISRVEGVGVYEVTNR